MLHTCSHECEITCTILIMYCTWRSDRQVKRPFRHSLLLSHPHIFGSCLLGRTPSTWYLDLCGCLLRYTHKQELAGGGGEEGEGVDVAMIGWMIIHVGVVDFAS